LNSILCDELKPGMFMTMLLIGWDSASGDLLYSSAGHEHIIFYRAGSQEVEARKSGGAPLGISLSSEKLIEENVLDLAPGDTAVLYTDGVTEAMDENDVEWEMDKFLAAVKKHGHRPAKDIVDAVLAEIAEHRGKAPQSDDITMVVVKRV
jgi:sigma-B regulation protein RsbU (phosphoserine phosphatase)